MGVHGAATLPRPAGAGFGFGAQAAVSIWGPLAVYAAADGAVIDARGLWTQDGLTGSGFSVGVRFQPEPVSRTVRPCIQAGALAHSATGGGADPWDGFESPGYELVAGLDLGPSRRAGPGWTVMIGFREFDDRVDEAPRTVSYLFLGAGLTLRLAAGR